jgi:hypothetical protein
VCARAHAVLRVHLRSVRLCVPFRVHLRSVPLRVPLRVPFRVTLHVPVRGLLCIGIPLRVVE